MELFRFVDPLMGPRQTPDANILTSGRLAKLNDKDLIKFKKDENEVFVTTVIDGKESTLQLGTQLMYYVDVPPKPELIKS